VISIVAGLIAAVLPAITIAGLILLLGAWLVVQGVMEIYTAWRIRDEVTGEWVLAAVGILRSLVGVIVLLVPIVGAILTVTFLAAMAIATGVAAVGLGLRLRGLRPEPTGPSGSAAGAAG
jgi:uncharacterized membrane protein HdeD (DUF308 family)